jgi:hypothetical protein
VNQCDVGDRLVSREQPIDVLRRGGNVLRGFERGQLAAHHPGELRQAGAVSAVDQHQNVAVARYEGIHRRFDGEGAAALHRHAHVGRVAIDDVR